jgi:hypothetical protein
MVVGYLTVFCEALAPHVSNCHAKSDYGVLFLFSLQVSLTASKWAIVFRHRASRQWWRNKQQLAEAEA